MQTFDPNALSSETMTLDELIHALPAGHRDLAWLGVRAFMMYALDCAADAIRVRPTSQQELDKLCPFDRIHPAMAAWRWHDRARLRSSL